MRTLTSLAFVAAFSTGQADHPIGRFTVGSVSSVLGKVYLSQPKTASLRLGKASMGKMLRSGDLVKVAGAGSSLILETKALPIVFGPAPGWQRVKRVWLDSDAKAVSTVWETLRTALSWKGGGIVFPTPEAVPPTLFTIVTFQSTARYRVVADGRTLYDAPKIDRAKLVVTLPRARDADGAKVIDVYADDDKRTTRLLGRVEEEALLRELLQANGVKDPSRRHLYRARIFAAHRQFPFARYEIDQLSKEAAAKLLPPRAQDIRGVRPAR